MTLAYPCCRKMLKRGKTFVSLSSSQLPNPPLPDDIRGCRSLGLALKGHSSLIWDRHPDELPEPSHAPEFLRRLWPPPSDETRQLQWHFDFPTDGLLLGDLGILEHSAGRAYGFRKLLNVATELAVDISGPPMWYEKTGSLEYR